MSRPLLLDLFCGAGGAAVGYHRAGFDILGVDINPQPNYPFPFMQADALEVLVGIVELGLNGWSKLTYWVDFNPRSRNGPSGFPARYRFDAIHASPPCQRYSQATNMHDKSKHPDLVGPVRSMLDTIGLPYVIENVEGAPLVDPVTLCGSMFGVERLRRHRLFETNWPLTGSVCQHEILTDVLSVTGHGEGGSHRGGTKRGAWWGQAERRKAMGIDWMNRGELAESIPPAYTEFVGAQLIQQIAPSPDGTDAATTAA